MTRVLAVTLKLLVSQAIQEAGDGCPASASSLIREGEAMQMVLAAAAVLAVPAVAPAVAPAVHSSREDPFTKVLLRIQTIEMSKIFRFCHLEVEIYFEPVVL